MKTSTQPNTLVFEGVLDELTSLDEIMSGYTHVKASSGAAPIVLDFSKVSRANSSGVLTWLRFMNGTEGSFVYVNAPVWLVGQFNMISGHFKKRNTVESFQAPFFSEKSELNKNVLMTVGKDVPLLADYTGFVVPNRNIDGEDYEPDFDAAQYFRFLREILAQSESAS